MFILSTLCVTFELLKKYLVHFDAITHPSYHKNTIFNFLPVKEKFSFYIFNKVLEDRDKRNQRHSKKNINWRRLDEID